jgi:hypothetical protein
MQLLNDDEGQDGVTCTGDPMKVEARCRIVFRNRKREKEKAERKSDSWSFEVFKQSKSTQ